MPQHHSVAYTTPGDGYDMPDNTYDGYNTYDGFNEDSVNDWYDRYQGYDVDNRDGQAMQRMGPHRDHRGIHRHLQTPSPFFDRLDLTSAVDSAGLPPDTDVAVTRIALEHDLADPYPCYDRSWTPPSLHGPAEANPTVSCADDGVGVGTLPHANTPRDFATWF